MHNTSPADQQEHAESGVRIAKERVRTLVCYTRDLHCVAVGKSHVSLPWCVRFAPQVIRRSHRRTDGMTGYRRAHGRSRLPRRYLPWSEKVFYLEQSKRKVQIEAKWYEGFSSESMMNVIGSAKGRTSASLMCPACTHLMTLEEVRQRTSQLGRDDRMCARAELISPLARFFWSIPRKR